MKKAFFSTVLAAWAIFSAAAENALPDPFFKFAGRDFSLAEAQMIAPDKKDLQGLRAGITAKLPTAAAITLCDRAGIKLSQHNTRQALFDSIMIMSDSQRKQLDQLLAKNALTLEKYLLQESMNIDNQLNEALRRWFKQVSSNRQIGEQQICDYYYRNLHIFRRTKLDENKVWVFSVNAQQTLQQAVSELMQGTPHDVVRKKYTVKLPLAQWFDDLQQNYHFRTVINDKYFSIRGSQQLYLMENDALKDFYLPLDQKVKAAISNTLYDALAKAYLAEMLKKNFSADDLVFY